ncbi:MAG: hypothetical protein JKX71_10420 [Amylibacter sp.]|nr:hypothetical protein [Amylibacter sp.]
MQTGTKISGALHLTAIGVIAFGGFLFNTQSSDAIRISEVSIISSEDFAAMQSTDPAPSPDVASAPEIKTPKPNQEAAPEIAQPEEQALATEEVAILQPIAEPTPAPRIDTQSAPKPEVNATEAQTPQEEATPDETGIETAEPTKAQAPKEAATEIVTEADKPSEFAPTTSNIPRARPRDLAARVAKANAPKPEVEPATQDNTVDEIAAALAEAEAENNRPAVAQGPPLTGGEKEGLVLAVQQCWNVPIGLQDADDLVVIIAIELTQDGQLKGKPKLIDPTGTPTRAITQAFEAGRRALMRCAPYDLPAEKYEQWRQIEVVFNPKEMVLR